MDDVLLFVYLPNAEISLHLHIPDQGTFETGSLSVSCWFLSFVIISVLPTSLQDQNQLSFKAFQRQR